MDYGKLVSESFNISWRNKLLWIFGLFAASGSGGFNTKLPDGGDFEELNELSDALGGVSSAADFPVELVLPLILAAGLAMLVFMVLHLISVPALIDSVNRIRRGDGTFQMGQSFSVGLDFFLRMLGLWLLGAFALTVTIAFCALVVLVAVAIHSALVVLAILFLIPVVFVAIWLVENITSLAQRAMVVRNIGIGDSIDEAVRLFRGHLGQNIMIFLIYVGLSIGIGIAMMIIWLLFGIPIAAIALSLGVGLIPTLALIVLLGLPLSLVAGGFTGASVFNIYTLFYFELVEPTPPSYAMTAPPAASA